jgi:hypothetical protein
MIEIGKKESAKWKIICLPTLLGIFVKYSVSMYMIIFVRSRK